jgi:hypothetical protein
MPDKKTLFEKLKESKFGQFVSNKLTPVAGDVLEIVGDITGVETIERVGEFLNKKKDESPQLRDAAIEFEQYKLQWQLEIQQLLLSHELEVYREEVKDRDSARTRESSFTASLGKRDWLMAVVVISGLLALIGVITTLVFVQIPTENQRLADMCFGAVMSIGASIFSYYVGSSKSSHSKDETIKAIIHEQNQGQ